LIQLNQVQISHLIGVLYLLLIILSMIDDILIDSETFVV
jgi:hypothetical protein